MVGRREGRVPRDISKVVELALPYCDKRELITSYLLVCHEWKDIVLDRVWHTVSDVYFLFQQLAPLDTFNNGRSLEFVRHLHPTDWTHASQYFKRVRHLSYEQRTSKSIEDQVWLEVFTTRTPQMADWLPNLYSLKWSVHEDKELRYILLFLHCPIRELTVRLPSTLPGSHWKAFFEDIEIRAPNLTLLNLRTPSEEPEGAAAVPSLLAALLHLRSVSLPPSVISREALLSLCTKENLQVLKVFPQPLYDDDDEDAKPHDLEEEFYDSEPFLPANAFAGVQELALQLPLTILSRVIFIPTAFGCLKDLTVQTLEIEDEKDILEFTHVICRNLVGLSKLDLDIGVRAQSSMDEGAIPTPTSQISFTSLETLLRLDLHLFKIKSDCLIDIRDDDIMKIARSWKNLETLHLNPTFLIGDRLPEAKLTLSVCETLAELCPNLQYLGLYLNTLDVAHRTIVRHSFNWLNCFNVGLSIIEDPTHMAIFLRELTVGCEKPAKVRNTANLSWMEERNATMDQSLVKELEKRAKGWQLVDEVLLPAMHFATSKWKINSLSGLRSRLRS